MKILFYGSHLKHYYLADWLNRKGVECKLYLPDRDKPHRLPEWDDPSLEGNYPDWVIARRGPSRKLLGKLAFVTINTGVLPLSAAELLLKYSTSATKQEKHLGRSFDLVFTSAKEYILPALTLGPPVVFRPIGSDMSQLPFTAGSYHQALLSHHLRCNLRKVSIILAYQKDTIWAARFLNVVDKLQYYSVPTDVEALNRNIDKDFHARLSHKYSQYDRVFFLPSRKQMDVNNPAYKGSEKVLPALQKLLQGKGRYRIITIIRGRDGAVFRSRVRQMGMDDHFDYIESDLPLYELSAYMKLENGVVINDVGFRKTHLTGISREALSVGAVLLDWVDTNDPLFEMLYGAACPLLAAGDEESIYRQLSYVSSLRSDEHRYLRQNALDWAREHLHWEKNIGKLIDILGSGSV